MANVSVRLPPEIEPGLEEEASLTKRNRADVVREAVGEYLTRKHQKPDTQIVTLTPDRKACRRRIREGGK